MILTFWGMLAGGGHPEAASECGGAHMGREKRSPRFRGRIGSGRGAQAADTPVKARPVEYVRICSLYGEGFFYIPGTDTCLKIGGFLRIQTEYNAGTGGIVVGSQQLAPQGRFTRDLANDINYRIRAVLSYDVRQQTEYGTLRTYIRAGWNQDTPATTGGGTSPATFWDRAFIQFAGFTVGRAQSFFDIFSFSGTMSYLTVRTAADFFATGQNLWAYTAQFGNGLSATISLEDPATTKFGTADVTCPAPGGFFPLNGAPTPDSAFTINGAPCAAPAGGFGFRVPDIVGNLRVDQAWGWAGISAMLHDVSGAYWLAPNNVNNGHPADKYGWAVAVGAAFNIGTMGDMIGFQVGYAEGAPGQLTNSSWWQLYKNSNQLGIVVPGRCGVWRHGIRDRAHPGVAHQCRLSALLVDQVAHVLVRRLRGDRLQPDRHQPHLRQSRGRCPAVPGGAAGRLQLQPGLQLLSGWFAHAVEPGAAARYRSRHRLHQAQHRVQRPGKLRSQRLAAGLHQCYARQRWLRGGRSGGVVGDVPLAAQLLPMIAAYSV